MLTLVASALLASAWTAAPAPARPALLIVVTQETTTPLPPATLARLANEVRAIWRPYVDVEFGSPQEVRRPVNDDTLTLVITDRLSDGATGDGLGWIEFVNGEPSKTITVSARQAATLADEGLWAGRRLAAWPPRVRDTFVVRALGRSIAHEIGHYLFQSTAHQPRGLMRARFTVDELMDSASAKYRLLEADLRRLERRSTSYLLARRQLLETPLQ
jgi:hypothetical protein